MNRRIVIALATGAMVLGTTASFAEDKNESKPPMHMHKSEMDHRSDKDVATEYKSEAMQLREQAESHRKLARLYHGRTPNKGAANYEAVAEHCEQLAKFYENAAKEAEGVAAELSK
jgi:6-phosphogluconolactonase/glucosamine-6-phosphate isomerase/deaminase